MLLRFSSLLLLSSAVNVLSTTVTDIQGPAYLSPLVGQTVNVTALVTAKSTTGFYIAGTPGDDIRVSNGLFVFSSSATVLAKVTVGDEISFTGKVAEFRSSTSPNNLFSTELTSPTNIVVLSSNNTLTPVVLGVDRSPPTQQLSALDVGPDGFLAVPNNSSLISTVNATLQPDKYGMDFWESLEGQLVTVPSPVAIDFQNSFGEFWALGSWPATGRNSRGGLTITFGPDDIPDANPEVIFIGSPLDGTKNPQVAVGVGLTDITGVITYQFGFFYVLPVTAPTIISTPSAIIPPTTIVANSLDTCELTFGDYNVENMAPTSAHVPTVGAHIAQHLLTPDIMFIQEIQDNSGPTDNGVVSANVTLTALVTAIARASNVTYEFVDIDPVDGEDGGQPGGNIRQAYLQVVQYRPEKLTLASGIPAGGSLDAVGVAKTTTSRKPLLTFNPGRIDPTNAAWNASRKPLVAQWLTSGGQTLFTINLHLTSKGGSSSTQGDARTPVNLPVVQRTNQVVAVSTFVEDILAIDPNANIIVAGDCNEYIQTRSVFASLTSVMHEIDEVAGVDPVERYTYVFDQNTEQLDHAFISPALAGRQAEVEHIHVNNWSPSLAVRVSDHDPTVGKVRLC
ncbi:Endonuclease/exonuclease/phosphatase [Mycena floridula]|nr:Endonuclease/exonuclease/phosphatase [Mycena floridula]